MCLPVGASSRLLVFPANAFSTKAKFSVFLKLPLLVLSTHLAGKGAHSIELTSAFMVPFFSMQPSVKR